MDLIACPYVPEIGLSYLNSYYFYLFIYIFYFMIGF